MHASLPQFNERRPRITTINRISTRAGTHAHSSIRKLHRHNASGAYCTDNDICLGNVDSACANVYPETHHTWSRLVNLILTS